MVLGHVINDGKRTQDVIVSQNVTFDSLLLAPGTLNGLKSCGFYKPSPIQLHGIPLGKCGFDLLLEAKSGTGKTAVFSVICLEKINLNNGLQAVILAPTREIASQICDVIKQIGASYKGLRVEVVMGGLPLQDDIEKLSKNKCQILVGSPGRLRHLLQDNHINASAVRLLVLDEVDKLMEKSFITDINYIFSILPKEKQVIMSSATYPEITKTFIKNYVQNAQHVCPDTNSILLGINQKVTFVKQNSNIVKQTKYRFEELLKILTKKTFKQCLIFCNYQARIAELHKMLRREKWPAQQLYGQQDQVDRLDALKSLQQYKCRILISTDLAARGIDASNVDLVINFEPPHDWQTYLHRIGRAGRFGTYGIAITILSEGSEKTKFAKILDAIKAPINLRNLWSDEQFSIDDNNLDDKIPSKTEANVPLVTPTNNTICNNYEKLWSCLSKDITGGRGIPEIDCLGNSENRLKIETFSELVESLENYKTPNNNENYKYPTIPMLELPVEDYLKSIDETINKLPLCTEDQEEDEDYKENVDNKENGCQLIVNVKNGSVETARTVITEDPVSVKHETPTVIPVESSNKIVKNDTESDEYYVPNIDEDLIKAGLPTAFRSSKEKNSLKHAKKHTVSMTGRIPVSDKAKTEVVNNDAKLGLSKENNSSQIENCYSKWKSMKIDLTRDKATSSSSEDDYGYRAKKSQFHTGQNKIQRNLYDQDKGQESRTKSSTSKNNDYNQSKKIFKLTKDKANVTSSSSEEDDYGDFSLRIKKSQNEIQKNVYRDKKGQGLSTKSPTSTADYSRWYNNLKLRVKQIEIALYLNEMSNLN